MMFMMIEAVLFAIDEYDGTTARFSDIIKEAFNLSRQLQGRKLWTTDFRHYVADAVGVTTNIVGAWIDGAMSPASIDDRHMVLRHVRAWLSPS